MTTDLRDELTALAETQTFSPDPSAWDRGRRARRNARLLRTAAVAAVLAIVIGAGAIAVRPERQSVAPADVPGGAIPSRIYLGAIDFDQNYRIGRASVALGGNSLVLIGAEDGAYHRFPVPGRVFALSPDGYRVAWWADDGAMDLDGRSRIDPDRIYVADLRTGGIVDWAHNFGSGAEVRSLTWDADSTRVRWNGRDDDGATAMGAIDVVAQAEEVGVPGRYGWAGILSPSRDMTALASDGEVAEAAFKQIPPRGSRRWSGIPVGRALPADLYPDGAVVTPVGWADEDTVVAIVDPPPSDEVERPRLALITSPDVPESEWTYREFLPRLPPEATSFAVDLIPDLTGDPDQELTHDFLDTDTVDTPHEDLGRVVPRLIASGLAVLLAGYAFIRMMRKRV